MYILFDALNRWLRTYEVKIFKREKQGSNEYDSKLSPSIHTPLTDGSLTSNISKKKKGMFSIKTSLVDQLHNVFCP